MLRMRMNESYHSTIMGNNKRESINRRNKRGVCCNGIDVFCSHTPSIIIVIVTHYELRHTHRKESQDNLSSEKNC